LFFVGLSLLVVSIPGLSHAFAWGLTLAMTGTTIGFCMARQARGELDPFEVFIPFSIVFILSHGVGAIYLLSNPKYIPSRSLDPYIVPALVLNTVGYFCFTAGYLTLWRQGRVRGSFALDPVGITPVYLLGAIGFGAELSGIFLERVFLERRFVSPILSTFQQFSPLYVVAWVLVWHLYWSRRFSRLASLVMVMVFGGATGVILYGTLGGKSKALLLLGIPAVGYWYARRRIPWKALGTLVVVGVFGIFPLYNTYRLQNPNLPSTDRLMETFGIMRRWDAEEYMDRSVRTFFARMAVLTSTAAVLRDVGRTVDYRYGESLVLTPISLFIPRILWPEKPLISRGREFGETFHLVAPTDRQTQIAPTATGELYWNFGTGGVLIGFFLLGGMYRWIFEKYGRWGEGSGSVRTAFYLALLWQAMHFDGNMAVLLAGWAKTLLLGGVVVFAMERLGLLQAAPAAAARMGGRLR
jgi:hypothetical protein